MLKSGKKCQSLSFVQSGLLRIFVTINGKEVTQWTSKKSYFATDFSSYIFETPSRWTIQALVDTKVYTIAKDDYKKLGGVVPK